MTQNGKQFGHRFESNDGRLSLYGLTPKVGIEVIEVVRKGATQRARTLIAPLHPIDQAELLKRMPAGIATSLTLFLTIILMRRFFQSKRKYARRNCKSDRSKSVGLKSFVTTITDVIGFSVFLGLAAFYLI